MTDIFKKCQCGRELEKYDTRYILDPIKQDFICRRCWIVNRETKRIEEKKCCRCGKKLEGKDFIDHRFCLARDKTHRSVWGLFCIQCENYLKMGEHH
jgi:hypothetical protein